MRVVLIWSFVFINCPLIIETSIVHKVSFCEFLLDVFRRVSESSVWGTTKSVSTTGYAKVPATSLQSTFGTFSSPTLQLHLTRPLRTQWHIVAPRADWYDGKRQKPQKQKLCRRQNGAIVCGTRLVQNLRDRVWVWRVLSIFLLALVACDGNKLSNTTIVRFAAPDNRSLSSRGSQASEPPQNAVCKNG